MSETTGGTTASARRWRAVYDVAIGVTLFVSLLLPAVRQASTGTLPGLRNGLLLLLLDVVVLVMLSRYITRPSRNAAAPETAPPTPAAPDISLERPVELLDDRGAPRDITGLTFTDTGIAVHPVGSTSHAELAWADCAAVVLSQVWLPDGSTLGYLQFVALHEDRIRRGVTDPRAKAVGALLGLTDSAAAMVWAVSPELLRLPPPVLAYVEQHHPHVRVVRPDVVDHTE